MLHFKLSRLREDVPALLKLAGPLLIGQLAVIAFGVLDTAMTARYSAEDLAALAMASAIFISVYVGLTGVLQEAGHTTFLSDDKTRIASTKSEFIQNIEDKPFNPLGDLFKDEKLSKYTFQYSSDHEIDHLLIRTQYFKLKN